MVPKQPHASATACDQQPLGLIPRSLTDQSAHGMSPNAFFKRKKVWHQQGTDAFFMCSTCQKAIILKNNLNLFHTKIR